MDRYIKQLTIKVNILVKKRAFTLITPDTQFPSYHTCLRAFLTGVSGK
ncbi:hypothetical protein BSMD_015430 [Bacillus subtilis Miyagi-4]|nr:hypothetical protein BSMD_015430 [Bacillus subtilis Miyagi-4]